MAEAGDKDPAITLLDKQESKPAKAPQLESKVNRVLEQLKSIGDDPDKRLEVIGERSTVKKGKSSGAIKRAAVLAGLLATATLPFAAQAESTDHGAYNANTRIVEPLEKFEDRASLGEKINRDNSYGSDTVPLDMGNFADTVEKLKEGGINLLLDKGRDELQKSINSVIEKIPDAGWKTKLFADAGIAVAAGYIDNIISEKIRKGMLKSLEDQGKLDEAAKYSLDPRNPDNMWLQYNKEDQKGRWSITYGADPENMAVGVNIKVPF